MAAVAQIDDVLELVDRAVHTGVAVLWDLGDEVGAQPLERRIPTCPTLNGARSRGSFRNANTRQDLAQRAERAGQFLFGRDRLSELCRPLGAKQNEQALIVSWYEPPDRVEEVDRSRKRRRRERSGRWRGWRRRE